MVDCFTISLHSLNASLLLGLQVLFVAFGKGKEFSSVSSAHSALQLNQNSVSFIYPQFIFMPVSYT